MEVFFIIGFLMILGLCSRIQQQEAKAIQASEDDYGLKEEEERDVNETPPPQTLEEAIERLPILRDEELHRVENKYFSHLWCVHMPTDRGRLEFIGPYSSSGSCAIVFCPRYSDSISDLSPPYARPKEKCLHLRYDLDDKYKLKDFSREQLFKFICDEEYRNKEIDALHNLFNDAREARRKEHAKGWERYRLHKESEARRKTFKSMNKKIREAKARRDVNTRKCKKIRVVDNTWYK